MYLCQLCAYWVWKNCCDFCFPKSQVQITWLLPRISWAVISPFLFYPRQCASYFACCWMNAVCSERCFVRRSNFSMLCILNLLHIQSLCLYPCLDSSIIWNFTAIWGSNNCSIPVSLGTGLKEWPLFVVKCLRQHRGAPPHSLPQRTVIRHHALSPVISVAPFILGFQTLHMNSHSLLELYITFYFQSKSAINQKEIPGFPALVVLLPSLWSKFHYADDGMWNKTEEQKRCYKAALAACMVGSILHLWKPLRFSSVTCGTCHLPLISTVKLKDLVKNKADNMLSISAASKITS